MEVPTEEVGVPEPQMAVPEEENLVDPHEIELNEALNENGQDPAEA